MGNEDPIVRSFQLCIKAHEGQLHLFQYPGRSSSQPFNESRCEGFSRARIKPRTGLMEVEVPLQTSMHYDKERGRLLGSNGSLLSHQTLAGQRTLADGLMVGIIKDDGIHLMPMHAAVQLRSQLAHLASTPLVAANAGGSEARAVTMSVKRDEDEANASGSSFYASSVIKVIRQMEDERWNDLEWKNEASADSDLLRQQLVTPPANKEAAPYIPKDQFLGQISPRKVNTK